MKNIPNKLYKKIQDLSEEVKRDLRKKGIVVPVENDDGSISVGYFKIVKTPLGYDLLNPSGDIVVDRINLPQSAVLIANAMALGKYKDENIVNYDRQYGYALFEEELHKRFIANSKKKSLDHYELMVTKTLIAKAKKDSYKNTLVSRYQKLMQIL